MPSVDDHNSRLRKKKQGKWGGRREKQATRTIASEASVFPSWFPLMLLGEGDFTTMGEANPAKDFTSSRTCTTTSWLYRLPLSKAPVEA